MDDAMPARAVTAPARPREAGPYVKFPCGHLEPRAAVGGRTRGSEHVIWVGCLACNLVVLAVAADASLPARRRGRFRSRA